MWLPFQSLSNQLVDFEASKYDGHGTLMCRVGMSVNMKFGHSHHRGADLCLDQATWDLWWKKWHWDRFYSELYGFPLSVLFNSGCPCSYTVKLLSIVPACIVFPQVSSFLWSLYIAHINDFIAAIVFLHSSLRLQSLQKLWKEVSLYYVGDEQ
jgi:hypothetical protein